MDRTSIESRLHILHAEALYGHERLEALEQECTTLRATCLRIAGAAQVLAELLTMPDPPAPAPAPSEAPAEGPTPDAALSEAPARAPSEGEEPACPIPSTA